MSTTAMQVIGQETPCWDVEKTTDTARALFDSKARSESWASFQSVIQRFEHAKFHLDEVARRKDDLVQELKDRDRIVSRHELVQTFLMQAEAHALGAVQSLHAIPDLVCFGTFYATGLHLEKPKPLNPRDVTCSSVIPRLQKQSDFQGIAKRLGDLKLIAGWDVLDGLSNRAKHRSIVRSSLSQDFTGQRPEEFELKFQRGTYETKTGVVTWNEISITELLHPVHDTLDDAWILLGVELAEVLERRAHP